MHKKQNKTKSYKEMTDSLDLSAIQLNCRNKCSRQSKSLSSRVLLKYFRFPVIYEVNVKS